MNRTPDEIIAAIEMCATSGVGNLLIGDNEMARLVLAWREATAHIERLEAAMAAIVREAGRKASATNRCNMMERIALAALNSSQPDQENRNEP